MLYRKARRSPTTAPHPKRIAFSSKSGLPYLKLVCFIAQDRLTATSSAGGPRGVVAPMHQPRFHHLLPTGGEPGPLRCNAGLGGRFGTFAVPAYEVSQRAKGVIHG